MALPTQMIGGLVSGMDTANIIEQLMTIERRPISLMEAKVQEHQTKLEAYRGVNNLLLQFNTAVSKVADSHQWNVKDATSSNTSVLTATPSEYADLGTHTFRVGRLAQTAQFMSNGFADRESTPISPYATGEIRIDSAKSRVDLGTPVNLLNGGTGIYHGSVLITDKAGRSAEVDLSTAETVQDIIDAINNTAGIDVEASIATGLDAGNPVVLGDALTISDLSGGAGTLRVENYNGSTTATDLGLEGKTAGGATTSITGDSIYYVGDLTPLSSLRDGLGINGGTLGKVVIDKFGTGTNIFTVDLADAQTIRDVTDAITAAGAAEGISARISDDGRGITIESVDPTATLVIQSDVSDGPNTTAQDLGIAGSFATPSVVGHELIADMNSVQVASLAGVNGTGINGASGDYTQVLGRMRVTDDGGGTWHTLDLNDLTGADSLADVVHRLNEEADAALGAGNLEFRINSAGNGIEAVNKSAASTFEFDDQDGTAATDLGLAGESIGVGKRTNGGDLDRKYLSGATYLGDLNNGKGVNKGYILLTNSNGQEKQINLATVDTIQDVMDVINDSGMGVVASINATGDGIQLVDNAGGSGDLKVEEDRGGTTAKDLGLLGIGTDVAGKSTLNGSFERVVEVAQTDTLQMVMMKIADAGANLHTSIINDGSGYAPYRLVVTSDSSGQVGDFVLDTDVASLQFNQSSRGEDSVLLYGQGGDGVSPLMIRAATNTNNSAVLGLSIEMKQASDQYVTISVGRDTTVIEEEMQNMVATHNEMHALIDELDGFDSENGVPGLLFADGATRELMSSITDMFFEIQTTGTQGISTWFDAGLSYTDKGKLELDASTLSSKLKSDFEAVRSLLIENKDVARGDMDTGISAVGGSFTDQPLFVLNDGSGVNSGNADDIIIDKFGDASTLINVELTGVRTLQAVIDAINTAGAAHNVSARISDDKKGFVVESTDPLANMKITSDGAGNTTAEDLGIFNDVGAGQTLTGSSVIPENLTDIDNLINGDTSSESFGLANGYESAGPIPEEGHVVTIAFPETKELTQVILNHVNTSAMPSDDYALRDFLVEYQNAATGNWETLRSVQGNKNPLTFLGFENPTRVNALRITGYNSNAADNKFRLTEIQAMEKQGLASKLSAMLEEATDSKTGFFADQQDLLDSKIDDLKESIESMEERMEGVELGYLQDFSAMESALAQMQSQGDYFMQQMDAWNKGSN